MSATPSRSPRILVKQITLVLCATLVVLLTLASSDLLPASRLFTPVAGPQTLEELVEQAPLIFIGEVGPVVRYLELGGYDEDGTLRAAPMDPHTGYGQPSAAPLAPNSHAPSGLPVTDFQLFVEQVIRDDGTIAAGEPIIVRVAGAVTAELHQLAQSTQQATIAPGERYLFLLSPNPDGKGYGFYYGPPSRLLIDEEGVLRVSNGLRSPLRFDESDSPVTLVELIRVVVEQSPEATGAVDTTATNRPVVPLAPLVDHSSIWAGFRWIVPDSLQAMIDPASLIVIAQVGEIAAQFNLAGEELTSGQPMGAAYGLLPARIPATDFHLEVEEIIRDDGTVAANEPLILRVPGIIDENVMRLGITQSSHYPYTFTGDRYLFLLTRNPDGTYGLYHSPWSRLIVDGDTLRVSNGAQEPLQFEPGDEPITLDAFIEVVESSTPPAVAKLDPLPLAPSAPASPLALPTPTPAMPASPLATPEASDGTIRETAVRYNPPSSMTLRAPPSLDGLLSRAPLIFIGEVGPIEQYTEFETMETAAPTVDAAGNVIPGQPVINLLLPGMPMTEFRLMVDEVIRDDGKIAAGEPIILRSIGHVTAESAAASANAPVPATFTGQRYLFLLSPYPDNQAYAFYFNTYSRLIIDGDILRVSNGDRDPLVFDESDGPVTLEGFMQAVAASHAPAQPHSPLSVPTATAAPDVAQWPEYRHEPLGLSVRYPPDWQPYDRYATFVRFNDPYDFAEGEAFNLSTVAEGVTPETITHLAQYTGPPATVLRQLIVDGQPALYIEIEAGTDSVGPRSLVAILAPDERILSVTNYTVDPAQFEKIVSTVRLFTPVE